jgi:hypothetical protein
VTDFHPGALSEEANERIFREQIVPMFLTGAPAQRQPVAVIVGGQTGAGKTAVTATVKHALGQSGGFVNINMDFYNPQHPSYHRWRAEDEHTASAKVRPDGERWWTKAQQHAIDNRCHVVLESAMRHKLEFEDIARRFHDAGYRVEVAIVAVPESLSRLGMLQRYWGEVQEVGHGRRIDPAIHDECYRGVVRGAAAVDAGDLAHSAFAFRRNGEVIYANHAGPDGAWREAPRLAAAVQAERHRPWTDAEQHWYAHNSSKLRAAIDPRHHPELDAIDAKAAPLLAGSQPAAIARLSFPIPARGAVARPAPGPGPGQPPDRPRPITRTPEPGLGR